MIYMKKEQVDEILAHSRGEAPAEACGILAGREGRVERVYQMVNMDRSSSTFLMEPKEQLKVMKEIRGAGLELTGIYHSHPESEAYPSAHDVELAFYPEASYVIISLKDAGSPGIKSYRIAEGVITGEEMVVES